MVATIPLPLLHRKLTEIGGSLVSVNGDVSRETSTVVNDRTFISSGGVSRETFLQ